MADRLTINATEMGRRAVVLERKRKGGLTPDEVAMALAWRSQRMSWDAIARNLGRRTPDVRAECELAANA